MAQSQVFLPQTFGTAAVPENYYVTQVRTANAATVWVLALDLSIPDNSTVRRYARSTDGGSTWTGGNINIPAGLSVGDLHPLDGTTAWLTAFPEDATATGAGVYKTTDGGVTWNRQPTATYSGAAAFPNIVYFWDANNGITMGDPNPNPNGGTVGSRFEVYTTTDGGANWVRNQTNAPATTHAAEYGLTGVRAVAGNTIWAGGYNDVSAGAKLYKSTDRGLTWSAAGTDIPKGIDFVAFADANNGLMSDGLDLVRTTNGGATNTALTYAGTFRDNGLDNVPGLPNTFISVGSADAVGDSLTHYGSSISRDGGLTWTTLERNKRQTQVDVISPNIGWSGGITNSATAMREGDVFKLNASLAPATATKASADVQQAVQAFPNPSKDGVFTVRVALSKAAPRGVVVTDALGREVYNKTLLATNAAAHDILVDLSKHTAGLYTLRLETVQGTVVKKLVIQ
ncbi:hypothetical protein B0919_05905 [Hymenobacter sp. CRA2]|nr:hypothetical protein B0919_05905 [Hymenobacter sp. CRA2]